MIPHDDTTYTELVRAQALAPLRQREADSLRYHARLLPDGEVKVGLLARADALDEEWRELRAFVARVTEHKI